MKTLKLSELGIPKGIMKKINEYKVKSAHIRACEYSNKHFGTYFNKGTKQKMIYIKKVPRGYQPTDVLAFEDDEQVPEGFIPDYELMADKLILHKVNRIFEVLNYRQLGIEQNHTLQEFFK